jgi:hypothetical protein
MRWTEGHIWISEKPLITNNYYFQYKYVLLDKDRTKFLAWERGVDRIADLEILPEFSGAPYRLHDLGLDKKYNTEPSFDKFKRVELNDEWESYTVTFSVVHPVDEQHDEINLVGNWPGMNNVVMHKIPREINWMKTKYGKLMQPYECTLKFQNTEGDSCG